MKKLQVEELTEAMHATFTVDEETDKKHRVWAVCGEIIKGFSIPGYFTKKDLLRMQQVSEADFDKYCNTWPGGKVKP